jgi:hypothetical protein
MVNGWISAMSDPGSIPRVAEGIAAGILLAVAANDADPDRRVIAIYTSLAVAVARCMRLDVDHFAGLAFSDPDPGRQEARLRTRASALALARNLAGRLREIAPTRPG